MIVGIDLSTPAAGGDDPVGLAQRAEALGFDFVSASDHPSGRGPTLETWTLLTWVLARTRRVRVATRVLSVPFRNPAVTAKMAESLSRLSARGRGARDACALGPARAELLAPVGTPVRQLELIAADVVPRIRAEAGPATTVPTAGR